jgi:hypothetical protein
MFCYVKSCLLVSGIVKIVVFRIVVLEGLRVRQPLGAPLSVLLWATGSYERLERNITIREILKE